MNRAECLEALSARGIRWEMEEHEPVYTLEEMRALGLCDKGTVAKNLFLRNEKGNKHYLVFMAEEKSADLKALRTKIGSTRLSFASDERLAKHLGLTKGSVTPLGLLNNEDHAVTWVVDRDLVGKARLGIHPMDNEATLWISWDDLKKLVDELGNPVILVSM